MVFGLKIFDEVLGTLTNEKGRKSASAAQELYFQKANEELKRAQALNTLYSQQANIQRGKALQETRQGFDQGLGLLRASGETARVNAARLGAGAQGRATLNTYNRGLSGTTAGRAMNAAAADRSNRFLADTESRLAQLEARLQAQRGQALAGQRNVIASGQQASGAGELASANALLRLYGSRNDVAYNPIQDITAIAQTVGGFL